jgi:amino acid adenylation domain-containing protein/thioester reductase-like protein
MALDTRRAVIIGETKVCIQCTEYLLNNNWEIVFLVSDDKVVTDWARAHSVKILAISHLDTVETSSFYLFSIINSHIIPKTFLENKNILLGLNYHDGPLPRYAGINSTTWAIINNEKQHGVTLHKITSSIDDGDIAAQSLVSIDEHETAISLNLKCSEHLFSIFKEVIAKIEKGNLEFTKQNLRKRTYYGLKEIPANYGIINGIRDIKLIDRLVRGLTFGEEYDNPVATVKAYINGKLYIAEHLVFKDKKKETILFDEVRDIYGNKTTHKIKYKDLSIEYTLGKKDVQYLSTIKAQEKEHKKQIIKFLEDHSEVSTKIFDYISDKADEFKDLKNTVDINISKHISTDAVLTVICFVLARFFRDNFITSLYLNEKNIPLKLRNLVENRNFIYINQEILSNGFDNLENYLIQLQENSYILTKDFGYRYQIQLLTDIAITLGDITSTDQHKVVIAIKNNKINIQGSVYLQAQINSIAESIKTLLNKDIQKEIKEKDLRYINILSEKQYQQIVYEWNQTEKSYPKDKTIHQLFEAQVLRTPDNIAVVFEDTKLTYQELNNKANQLAHYLLGKYNVKPDDLIGLCLDRNELMIVAILAVLKSGGAYVPIEPNYPDERIKYILEDANTEVILTNDVHKNRLQQIVAKKTKNTDVIAIDNQKTQNRLAKQKAINPITATTSRNLIYVIYTSGTTGNPKGVMVEHVGVVNTVLSLYKIYDIDDKSKLTEFTSYMFDVSVSEFFIALFKGSELHLLSETRRKDAALIADYINNAGINYVYLPPAILSVLPKLKYETLKGIVYAGEPCDMITGKYWSKKYKLYNYYGPTETTIYATGKQILDGDIHLIGKPISNIQCYILDKQLFLLPIGAVGELYIGGIGLARGYLNRPELTAEKFIRNPFVNKIKNKLNDYRLYKTGDLVRWSSDGNIEYIGRNDFQIKIRGYRIELGEIESVLLNYPGVKQCIALVKEHLVVNDGIFDSKYIVAYYVAEKEIVKEELIIYLNNRLPGYMVPSFLLQIENLPITVNGKLDRKYLPAPELVDQLDYVAPKTELEWKICTIYAQVLNLPIERVGVKSDFFRMGGDSISSIQIVSKIRQQLKRNIKVQDIFKYRTAEQLIVNALAHQNINIEQSRALLENTKIKNSYLANNLQQGIIYNAIRQQGKTDNAYLAQFIWNYKVPIDKDKFRQAWQLTQKKHPSLRLRFDWSDALTQIIDKKQKLNFRYMDLYDFKSSNEENLKLYSTQSCNLDMVFCSYEHQAQITNLLNQDRQESYNLHKGSLFRIYLLKLSEKEYTSVLSAHHIILDGWSSSLLLDNVHEIYSQLLRGEQPHIEEDTTYQKAQQYLQENKDEHLGYWKDYLKQIEDRGDLKTLLKSSAKGIEIKNHLQVEQEQEEKIEIAEAKLAKLKEVCQINAVTINAVIQYAWHKIVHLYAATSTTVVGTVVSGRNIPIENIEHSVGLFINTLPLVVNHSNKLSIIEQIKSIQNVINEINSRSNINLADIQAGSERLFDSILAYENYPALKSIFDLKCESEQNFGKVDYPLAVIIHEKKQTLTIRLKYAGELFEQETISGLLNRMLFFIEQVAENPYENTLHYLTQEEYQRIVIDYNKTEYDYPKDKTIHQLFEEQVLKTPGNIAVVYEDTKLTYQELNNKANQLAHYLLNSYEVKPDDLIVLCLDRSEYTIITMLAVLKAGGAYVPIDPNYPDERIRYILSDSNSKVILINNVNKKRLHQIVATKNESIDIVVVDSKRIQNKLIKQKDTNPIAVTTSNNLVYVIYTSGTTGNPKGVMIEHHSLLNYVIYLIKKNNLNNQSRGSQYANFGFDAAVIDTFPILLSGGVLYIVEDINKLDLLAINDFFIQNNITYTFLPTQIAENFFELQNTSLKKIIVGGDKLQKFVSKTYEIINAYGPTEATVQVTEFAVDKAYANIPIGKPINNVKCYIVDNNLKSLPAGVIGELVVGGEVLARGYYNQPELTVKKFIANPFQTEKEKAQNKNSRIYKTGDLVRMLSDGNLEYIGRNDFQVKIRGFRIELGEIENKLLSYPEIKQAAVLVKEGMKDSSANISDKYIVAYYVADKKLKEIEIYNYLASQLPEYMLPSMLIYLNKLPLTINGKLDRSALPELKFEIDNRCVAPRNEREQLICEAFTKILGLERISINDDFFKLGGNSLKAITLTSILQNNFDVKIAHIFNLRTPLKLAEYLQESKNLIKQKLEQVKSAYKGIISTSCKDISVCKFDASMTYTQVYFDKSKIRDEITKKKPIHSVLLTGATGYLGCNLLNQLLKMTDYDVCLPIRAKSQQEAIERINKKYQFYFDKSLDDVLGSRIFVLKADLERNNLGLLLQEYRDLITKIDSVIHTAALVKYYGEYDKFYSANVQATINLLEFTRLTKLKDFHYISTIGVLRLAYTPINREYFIEDDLPEITGILDHIYAQTKLQGEHQIIKYRDYGLNTNIYRVGNLAFMAENYRVQENIEDNAFYNWLKCLFTIRCSTEVINTVEISQTDLTAQAIVKLFDRQGLNNQVYHVLNPYLFDLTEVLKKRNFEIFSLDAFIDLISKYIQDGINNDLIVNFLLNQGWLDWWEKRNSVFFNICQDKTQYVLKHLDFEWPQITYDIMNNYLNSLGLVIKDKKYAK